MILRLQKTGTVFSFALFFLICWGCSGQSPLVHYYTLNPVTVSGGEIISHQSVSIVVGPVYLSGYLNRPHMVTRSSENRVNVLEFHRWAGNLKDEITDALYQNLAALLPDSNIILFSRSSGETADTYQIILDISRFDGLPGQSTRLIAEWKIKDIQNRKNISVKTTIAKDQVLSNSYDALAASMSKTLKTLSRQIALELSTYLEHNPQ